MAKIDNAERIKNLEETKYKIIFGVDKPSFDKMFEILAEKYAKMHERGGKPPTLSVLDKLIITLGYWREYRPYRNIAFDYGVGKSAIGNAITWTEDTLVKDGAFSLPSKRAVQRNSNIVCLAAVDVTEQEIERPKKNKMNGIRERKNGTR